MTIDLTPETIEETLRLVKDPNVTAEDVIISIRMSEYFHDNIHHFDTDAMYGIDVAADLISYVLQLNRELNTRFGERNE